MERHVVELARQIVRVELLIVQLIDEFPGAVLPLLAHRLGDQFECVRLGHEVGVERARDIGDVHHLGAHRIADLERRHRARTADVVDADDALAVGIHLLDEALEVLGKLRAFRERRDGAQHHLLGGSWRDGEPHAKRHKSEKFAHRSPPFLQWTTIAQSLKLKILQARPAAFVLCSRTGRSFWVWVS
jgi:hypothetical protein